MDRRTLLLLVVTDAFPPGLMRITDGNSFLYFSAIVEYIYAIWHIYICNMAIVSVKSLYSVLLLTTIERAAIPHERESSRCNYVVSTGILTRCPWLVKYKSPVA